MTTPFDDFERALRPLVTTSLRVQALAESARRAAAAWDVLRAAAEQHMIATQKRPAGQRESSATVAALADVDRGAPIAPTARKHGIQPSTLFRALARRRKATAAATATEAAAGARSSAPTP